MKNSVIALLFTVLTLPALAQGAPPQGGANQPYTMEYYYKVQWGRQQEFLQLFLKNHYPLLKKSVESGRTLRNIVGALGPAGDGHHPIR